MVGTSSSSSSSCTSLSSLDETTVKSCCTIKFVCSYGGRILPRYPDGKLRYVGGEIRVVSISRSVPLSELLAKMRELCGWETVNLRCQLPTDDLDALISITSDEDLANLIEEYDLASRNRQCPLKIRAFLHPAPVKSPKSAQPALMSPSVKGKARSQNPIPAMAGQCLHQIASPSNLSVRSGSGRYLFPGHEIPARQHYHHLIHHGNYSQ